MRIGLLLVAFLATGPAANATAQPYGTDLLVTDWRGNLFRFPPSGPMSTIGSYGAGGLLWTITVDNDSKSLVAAVTRGSAGHLLRINPATGGAATIGTLSARPFWLYLDQNGDYLVGFLTVNTVAKMKHDGSAVTTILKGLPTAPIFTRERDSGDWLLSGARGQLTRYTFDWSSVKTTVTHPFLWTYEMAADPHRPDIYVGASQLVRYDARANTVSSLNSLPPGFLGDRGLVIDRAPGSTGALIYTTNVARTPNTVGSVLAFDRSGAALGTVATVSAPVTGLAFDGGRNLGPERVTTGNDRILRVRFAADAGKAYVVAFGLSGFFPGVTLPDGRVIPLNPDPLVVWTTRAAIPPVLTGNIGVLNTQGEALVKFNTNTLPVPPGTRVWAVGVTLDSRAPLGISQISAPQLFVL